MRPALATAFLLAAGCASAPQRQPPPPPAPPGAPEVRAVRVGAAPMVDGVENDPAWTTAPELVVRIGDAGDHSVRVKAAVHAGSVYLLVRWTDPTENREGFQGFGSGPHYAHRERNVRDAVVVTLPLQGPFVPSPDRETGNKADFWRWNGAATDGSGHAEDGVLTLRPWVLPPGFWAPEFGAELRADGEDREVGGADVLSRGRWADGEWTVEFARAISTGQADDRDLSGLAEIPMRVAVRDAGDGDPFGRARYADTPVLRLLLPPPLPEDRQGPFPEPRGAPRERR